MNPEGLPITSEEARPNRGMNRLLCGHAIIDAFFGEQSTVLLLDNGTMLEIGAWQLTSL